MRLYRTLGTFPFGHRSYFAKFAWIVVIGLAVPILATYLFFHFVNLQLTPVHVIVVLASAAVVSLLLVLPAIKLLLNPIVRAGQSMDAYRRKKESLRFPEFDGDEMGTLLEDVRAVVQSADNAAVQRQGVIEMLSNNMHTEVSALTLIGEEIREQHPGIAARMTEAGARMASLVDIFLETVRKEEELARKSIRVRRVNFAELGPKIRRAVEPALNSRRINLEMTLPEHSCYLKADEDLLMDVLIDLVGNAAKFSEEGGTIEFVVARRHGMLSIMVRDYGKGIFDVTGIFRQLRAKHGDGQSPTGLYFCRQIINRFEGTLVAQSDGEGKGSTFLIEMPVFRQSRKKR